MAAFREKTPWEQEWHDLLKKEEKFIARRKEGPTSVLVKKLDRFIPDKLSSTLNAAFFKGFQVIFEKGTGIIEKTYNKDKKEADFKVDTYAHEVMKNKKSARTFTKRAKASKTANLMISSVERIGLGLVGAGIPDIPLFIAMVLKSVYEVALSFGYEYESDEEVFLRKNGELNDIIDYIAANGDQIPGWNIDRDEQMRTTSRGLSEEMIYTKFLQGQFIVGIAGGVFDPIYVNRISNYAVLKYRRRFLRKRMAQDE
ncbi:MAG: EcsC family protein [Anaerovoracaceae bacterium]